MANKSPAKKIVSKAKIWNNNCWTVYDGKLRGVKKGSYGKESLFKVVAEHLPYEALAAVKKNMRDKGFRSQGVYIAHDSMGCPRYIGRGNIFNRLEARKKAQSHELVYFSFYVVVEKKHEREIETLLIRAAGPLLEFNDKKKPIGITPANIKDFEVGTLFYERQHKKGKKS